jgi:putative transposase
MKPRNEDTISTQEIGLPYWQLFYHAVWSTRFRERLLEPVVEPVAYELIQGKAMALGAKVFALNGMEDHVHLVVAIPPKLAPAFFIGQVKGSSSTRLNKSGLFNRPFSWQDEYAVFSLDAKRLRYHVAYVQNQKVHHARSTVIPALERTGDESSASS